MFEENKDLTLIMSDEAHFHLNGTVNKQNFRYLALENPRKLHQRRHYTVGELKTAIRENIQEIGKETLVKLEANFRKRLQICARENGHHLSDIIFCS